MKQVDFQEYDGPDKIINSYEMREIVKVKDQGGILFPSMFKRLDECLKGGFRTGEMYAVSGPTKNGKTLLAQTFTVNLYSQQVFSLWFTYELSPGEFLERFGDDMPMVYMPSILKYADMDWVSNRIIESFQKFNTRVVFIDHLHYLFDLARSKNPSIEIGQIIRRLKLLAVEHGLVIFLMCHTNKSVVTDLSYGAIRDSSFVAQESDCVIMMARTPRKGEDTSKLKVEFHRRTGVIDKEIRLIKSDGYLKETD